MPNSIDLTDSEGYRWDITSTGPGNLTIVDGTFDAFDGGLQLRVNGTNIGGNFSVDENGREVNVVPQLVDGIAVSRSILVSDSAISTSGFARFFESFTNTTDQTITITVETVTNSGADGTLQFTATSSGDTSLGLDDTGFVTDDFDTVGQDTAVMFAFGDGTFLPTGITVDIDDIAVTHTLTLAPGETQSLLQFAGQSTTAAESNGSLSFFASADPLFGFEGLLDGLTAEERNSVVNYSNVDIPAPATLVDSDGNRWSVSPSGILSTASNGALQSFQIPAFVNNIEVPVSLTENPATHEVTVVTAGFFGAFADLTATSSFRALEGQGIVRVVVTVANSGFGAVDLGPIAAQISTGVNPLQLVNTIESPLGPPAGVVLDDSESGSSGTLPALTAVFGCTDVAATVTLVGNVLTATIPDSVVFASDTRSFVFFFALNDTGLAALTDLARLNTPGPELLEGLSAAQVAAFENFALDEFDRLQQIVGSDGVDDTLSGHAWGDSILGGTGNDDISALGSDDFVNGGGGDDDIDGGDGNDSLNGEDDNDLITGGAGDDAVDGGLGDDHMLGQSGDDFLFGDDGLDTLIGGAGNDTLIGEDGNDLLSGNTGADSLVGGSGNDTLNGGAGGDRMEGGADSDVYIVNSVADVVIEQAFDSGFDEVRSSVSFSVAGQSIELVTLTGTANISAIGDIFANRLVGNGGTNTLTGNAGADTLDGGGGVDVLIGGNGGDVYIVDSSTDTITELAGGTGIDEIRSSVDYTMNVANIELITLTGTADLIATGTGAAERIVGNTGSNQINGFGGADTLEGGDGADIMDGGTQDDRMFGGGGDDNLFGDEGADSLDGGEGDDELDGGNGADTLLGGAGDDNLTGGILSNDAGDQLFGGDGNDFVSGGAGLDTLNGDAGNDTLSGGDGADSLFGGAGNDELTGGGDVDTGINRLSGGADGDTYFVNSANDVVIENAGDTGTDSVVSIISYTLTDNVEELRLVTTGFATNGTGNALDNRLTGSSNDNILDGRGGADTMEGGNGNDTYVVDNVDDVVRESGGTSGGIDTVRSTIGYQLGDSVENLQLIGTSKINGTGNDADNSISGNSFANLLNGGLGNDTLTSGAGSDVFMFDTAIGPGNVDHITDFFVGRDVVYLDDAIFTGLNLGRPPVTRFVNGTAALDADDRLMYDIATGTLRYDADGNGAGASVVVAIFDNNAALVNGSFLVI